MKIYTGKGDTGETVNLNGQKVSKNSPLIHFIGTLDELNSYLALVKTMLLNDNAWQFCGKTACFFIEKTQKNLMKIMTQVSDLGSIADFPESEVKLMEKEIDRLSGSIPQRHEMVVLGKNIIEAQIHVARAVARRAERLFFAMKENNSLYQNIGAYLNRLSDYLFVLSQQESLINVNFINQITGI